MTKYSSLAISIILLLAVGYVYRKFHVNIERDDKKQDLNIIKKYLLKERDYHTIEQISSINKPILWIYVDYDKNSRKWKSFGSRNSNDLNQDYLYLTIKSIINHNNSYFHIALIDDSSFHKLLDGWNVDFSKISNVQKQYIKTLALVKLMYKYGGISIEPSFILFKSLQPIYEKILSDNKMTVAEFPNNSINSYVMNCMPSTKFIGCVKNDKIMYEFGKHLEILVNQDYTNEINLEDLINKWLLSHTQNNDINFIDGRFIGTKDNNSKIIDLDRLLGSTYIDLNVNTYGLYIPKDDLIKRQAYNWFVYLDTKQVLESNTNIGKYLLLSNN